MPSIDDQRALTDDDLVAGFEGLTLAAGELGHPEHVRLTWIYLQRRPVSEVLTGLRQGLQRFAAHHGADGLYHETITWAFVLLIHERICRGPAAEPWHAFARRCPELLAYRPSILDRYYTPETLASPLAKRVFVWPDRATSADPPRAPTSP